MKRILLKLSCFLALAISVNASVGYLRYKVEDEIPYKQNRRAAYMTQHQFLGRAGKKMMLKTRTDLGHDSLNLPHGIWRVFDAYGFSNVQVNPQPKILFIGDSFLDDPHTPTNQGVQYWCNHFLGANWSYNIGANGCSGFAVFNELYRDRFFKQKPRLVVFETVERAMFDHISDADNQLKKGLTKTKPQRFHGLDLLLGNNLKDLKESKLWAKNKDKKYGFVKEYQKKKYWFLRNKCSVIQQKQSVIVWMKDIKAQLTQQGIDVVFVIAPDKESIFPDFFGPSQIPQWHELMREEGLAYIDMYSAMLSDPDAYYHASDTHWNTLALKLLAQKVADYYKMQLLARTH